jgi:hypothetical protein
MRKLVIVGIFILAIVGIVLISSNNSVSGIPVTTYKSPSCGCCVGHVAELNRNDFSVNTISLENLETIKIENNIPRSMWSCHTSFIGNYFVEGHVPIEAIEKLLEEKPNIDGIALPGMPAGSPGMPGYKNGEWIIYGIKNGDVSEFMRI